MTELESALLDSVEQLSEQVRQLAEQVEHQQSQIAELANLRLLLKQQQRG